jgi:serine/threonine protein kinase
MKPTPLLTQYIQSVENAADCFKTLLPIAPIIENGKPKFASGGFAIVFKMQGGDKTNLAVKCFTSEQAERGRRFQKIQHFLKQNPMPFWIDFQYIESELWVNTTPQDGDEYDIVAMPWVEGRTLGEAVREACQRGDKSALRQLLTKFIDMALLLLALPCAHGDLKHDNIMVGNDGKLYLVDYDGFFVPDFKGEKSQERGSDDYQHPSRNTTTFDRHIDDFSIAIIALSLVALCERPELYAQYNQGQNLIFSRADFAPNTLSQATIWAGLQLPKPITELLKYTEQQNSYKLPMLAGYLSELREKADEKLPIFNQTNDSLQIWWDNLTDLEREVLTINYKLSKIGWAIPEFYKYNSILNLAYLVKDIANDVDLHELVRLEKLILSGQQYNKLEIINLKFIYIFANLQELYCNYTKITSLSDIKNCVNLQSLNFSNTQIPSLSDIENCVNLQSLNFSNSCYAEGDTTFNILS